MKFFLLLLLLAVVTTLTGYSQTVSLSDTTITFKNQEGKILTRGEAQELMKNVFSIRQEVVQGKKIITLLPSPDREQQTLEQKIQTFRAGLIGKPLPEFTLTGIDGGNLSTAALRGKIIVINFWFTACRPCIQEIPHLNKLVEANKADSVVFIGPAPENEQQVKKFLKKYPFSYQIIPSAADYISISGIENFPTHIVADKTGIVRQVFIGYADDIKEKLQTEIDKLLRL